MSAFSKWWAMGGYSVYIWPAYGLVCTALVMHAVDALWQRIRVQKKLRKWLKSSQNECRS